MTSSALATFSSGLSKTALQRAASCPPRLTLAQAEGTEPVLLRNFLSDEEVAQLFEVANSMPLLDGAAGSAGGGATAASSTKHDVTYSASHVALNLHRDHHFERCCPELSSKISKGMQDFAIAENALRAGAFYVRPEDKFNVRCVELHTYTEGGGVLMDKHRDYGSVLTLSILLTEPAGEQEQAEGKQVAANGETANAAGKMDAAIEEAWPGCMQRGGFEGGELITWRDSAAVVHRMRRGDALLFHSEKVHNVALVTSGRRNSLVVELWEGQANRKDRFS